MKLYFLISLVIVLSCSNKGYNKIEIQKILEGNNRDSIIHAIKLTVRKKDTSMIKYLLSNADDPRISHKRSSYGKSIYFLRMEAIESISGISSYQAIKDRPDSQVIKFYRKFFLREL